MDSEPDFVASARELSEIPLRVRFFPFDVTLNMIVLMFPPPRLFRLFIKTFNGPKLIISAVEDAEVLSSMFRERFAPRIVDPIFEPSRPKFSVGEQSVYLEWVAEHCPEGVNQDDYNKFVMICDHIVNEWQRRRDGELRVLSGIRVLSKVIVNSVQILILFAIGMAIVQDNYFTVAEEGLGLVGVMLICIAAAKTLMPRKG